MTSLWWLGLGLVLLPVWWHRQKRQSTKATPLATARFLPRAEPKQRRVWRWVEIILLLLRCLLIAMVTAWLADMVIAWRGDTRIAPAADNGGDPLRWLAAHEREFKKDARIVVEGDAPMPAVAPTYAHAVKLETKPADRPAPVRHVYIESPERERWLALFAAADGPVRYVVDNAVGTQTQLVVWDSEAAPPPGMRAPLWWTSSQQALGSPRKVAWEGLTLTVGSAPAGRTWQFSPLLPSSAAQARALLSAWEYLETGAAAYAAPPGELAKAPQATAVKPLPVDPAPGPLREPLAWCALALFALERILAHVGKR
jgi:hypothetical protein